MLEQFYTSTRVITPYSGISPTYLVYLEATGAMLMWNIFRLYKVFRDGTQVEVGQCLISNFGLGSRVNGRHYWGRYVLGTGWILNGADELTGQWHSTEVLNPTWSMLAADWAQGSFLDDVSGVLLRNRRSRVGGVYHAFIDKYNLADGTVLTSLDLGAYNKAFDNIVWVKRNQVVLINYATGYVTLVDYGTMELLFTSKIDPCRLAAYDCEYDNIISLGTDYLLRQWTMTPFPASLSGPAFTTAPHKLMGTEVKVQLTGSEGEACSGWWVHWVLDVGHGYLEKEVSKTDEDGYAKNYYWGPAAYIGPETIQVRVVGPWAFGN
jgi:hypothetical protein